MRWIRRLFVILCFVATALLIWAGVYARKEGFTESWSNAIEREFSQRGYHIEIGKITLGAFRGLVAEDVTFFQDRGRTEPIAFLDDVFLDVDLSRVMSKEIGVNTLDVEEARLSLPLDPGNPNGKRLDVEKLSGRIVVTESVIEIVKAEAAIGDFDVDVKGNLVRVVDTDEGGDEEKKKKETEQATATQRKQLQGILRELEKYQFLTARPSISIEFSGDLASPEDLTVGVQLDAENFRKRGKTYTISSFRAAADYDGLERAAEISEFLLRDRQGELSLTGDWSEDSGRLRYSLESGADLLSLAEMFWKDKRLREVVFFNSPRITAEGVLDLEKLGEEGVGFPGELIGDFQAERFVTRGEVFSGLEFGFSVAEKKYYVRNLRLDHQSGVAFLNLKYDPDQGDETLQYQTEIKLDPHVFRPFFSEGGRKFSDAWEFGESSTVYFAAAGGGPSGDAKTWTNKGVVDLRNFTLNGVSFLEMESEFESLDLIHSFRDVKMKRHDGGIFAKEARFHPAKRLWEVEEVVWTTDLEEGASAFNKKLAKSLTKYQFTSPPTVSLSGQLDSRRVEEVGSEPRRNVLDIEFESEAIARYTFLGETITAEKSRGKIAVNGSRVHLKSLDAEVFGGTLQLEYDAKDVRSPERPFEARAILKDVPLEAVTRLYADTETIRGRVAAAVTLSGNGGDIATLDGDGTATITDGNLFAIPFFGPLSKAIVKARPGEVREGANVARQARATLRMRDGIIYSEDFEALTDSFRLRAAGEVSLVDNTVDLEAVVNTKDVLSSAVLTPVSELLTFSCTGTVTEPVWKSKAISNLGKVPAQVITELTTIPVEGLKKIGQGLFGPDQENGRDPAPEDADEEDMRKPKKTGLFQIFQDKE